jgi:hypothetical protein
MEEKKSRRHAMTSASDGLLRSRTALDFSDFDGACFAKLV